MNTDLLLRDALLFAVIGLFTKGVALLETTWQTGLVLLGVGTLLFVLRVVLKHFGYVKNNG